MSYYDNENDIEWDGIDYSEDEENENEDEKIWINGNMPSGC